MNYLSKLKASQEDTIAYNLSTEGTNKHSPNQNRNSTQKKTRLEEKIK